MKHAVLSCLVVLLAVAAAHAATPLYLTNVNWTPVGPGGGGAQYNPSIAPSNANLMYGFCDMGGVYRSTNGGRAWNMLPFTQAQMSVTGFDAGSSPPHSIHFNPLFDPAKAKTAYIGLLDGIKVTSDSGNNWTYLLRTGFTPLAIGGNPNPSWQQPAMFFVGDSAPNTALVGQPPNGPNMYNSLNGGATWTLLPAWATVAQDYAIDIYIDPVPLILPTVPPTYRWTVYAATPSGMYKSVDTGLTWGSINASLPVDPTTHKPMIQDFNAGTVGLPDTPSTTYLYITNYEWFQPLTGSPYLVPNVYLSVDKGVTWRAANQGLPRQGSHMELGVCQNNPSVAYVSSGEHGPTIYKTIDGGGGWVMVLADPSLLPPTSSVERDWITTSPLGSGWGWGGEPHEVEVCPTDPNHVSFSDDGRTFRSDNGGLHWFCCNDHETSNGSDWWASAGFETTTNYHVHFAPWDHNKAYISYTDIGLFRSEDRGASWRLAITGSTNVPSQDGKNAFDVSNTFYDVTFDPTQSGKMWAVASDQHDYPHEKMLDSFGSAHGAVLESVDSGATWTPMWVVEGGVPTSIVVDPNSKPGSRTLYVAVLGLGVYKSVDDGAHWFRVNNGLGAPSNMNAWMIKIMPDGTLYCALTMAHDLFGHRLPGALFKSGNSGSIWTKVNVNNGLGYLYGFDVDRNDQRRMYAATFSMVNNDINYPTYESGFWRSMDGGFTWKRTLNAGDTCEASIDPRLRNRLYATIEQGERFSPQGGVFVSEDWGVTWNKIPGLPFERFGPNYVSYDPDDSENIFVTTFGGGVWKADVPHLDATTFEFVASDPEASVTGSTWTNKTSIRFIPGVTDDWLIIGFAEYKSPNLVGSALLRMMVDGVPLASINGRPVSTSDYATFMTAKTVNLSVASHTISIDFAGSSASAVARVRNCRIVALRRGALEWSNSPLAAEAAVTLTTAPQTCASVPPWTPGTPGSYLLLWTAEFQGSPGYSTRLETLLNGVVVDGCSVTAKSTSTYQSYMGVMTVYCDTSAQTLSLRASKSGGSGAQSVRRARLFAIRLTDSRFQSAISGAAAAETTTSSTKFVPKLRTTIGLGTPSQCLMITSFRLAGSSLSWSPEALVVSNTSLVGAQPMVRPKAFSDYLPCGSMDVRTLGPGTPSLAISYRTAGMASAKIKYANMITIPLQ